MQRLFFFTLMVMTIGMGSLYAQIVQEDLVLTLSSGDGFHNNYGGRSLVNQGVRSITSLELQTGEIIISLPSGVPKAGVKSPTGATATGSGAPGSSVGLTPATLTSGTYHYVIVTEYKVYYGDVQN